MYGNNYYNPFNYQSFRPRQMSFVNNMHHLNKAGGGFFNNLFHKFNLNNFLTGTSKTLNVINQAIPIYYQVKPMFANAKTMFKIANAIKDDGKPNINYNANSSSNNYDYNKTNSTSSTDSDKKYENPIFFI